MRTKLRGAAALLVLLPLLAACSGGGAGGESTAPKDLTPTTLFEGLSGDKLTFSCAGCSGADLKAKQTTFASSFNKQTSADVTVQTDDCGITKLQGMVQANNVTSDFWQFCTKSDYLEAIKQGLLEPIRLLQHCRKRFKGLAINAEAPRGQDAGVLDKNAMRNSGVYIAAW